MANQTATRIAGAAGQKLGAVMHQARAETREALCGMKQWVDLHPKESLLSAVAAGLLVGRLLRGRGDYHGRR